MKKFYKREKYFLYNTRILYIDLPIWDFWGNQKTIMNMKIVIDKSCNYKIRILFANLLK